MARKSFEQIFSSLFVKRLGLLSGGWFIDDVKVTASAAQINTGGGAGSLAVDDGGAPIEGVTALTFSGATVSGATPNATVTITPGGGGVTSIADAGSGNLVFTAPDGAVIADLGTNLKNIATILAPVDTAIFIAGGNPSAEGVDGAGANVEARNGAINSAGNAGNGGASTIQGGSGGNSTGGNGNGGNGGSVNLQPQNGGSGNGAGIAGVNGTVNVNDVPIFDRDGNPLFAGISLVSVATAQFDKTNDTTLANIPGLSVNVAAAGVYTFEATLFTVSNVGTGVKAAIGGTCTAISIIYEGTIYSAGVSTASAAARTTTKGNAVGGITAVTVARIDITGTIVVNAAGTLTVQFAENTAIAATVSSVLINSKFTVTRVS